MDEAEVARRVQKTGGGTFAVSLPKEWALAQGVVAKSTAFITANPDGSLTLRARRSDTEKKRLVETGTDVENSLRKVISAYVSGADAIVVKGALAATVCEEARARLSALETIEESGDEVTLQVFEKGEGFTLDGVLKRMHVVVLALFGVSRQLFEKGTAQTGEAEKREREIDRMYFLALRGAVRARGGLPEALHKAFAAKALEDIADNLDEACREGAAVAPNARIVSLVEQAEETYRACFETLYLGRYSERRFALVGELEDKLRLETDELMKAVKKPGKALAMKGVLERLQDIAEYSKDLLEIGSDVTEFRKGSPEKGGPLKRE
ncbi:MAG: phosphate uptake regulator PhoU [Candidatus Micrarchaeota archaeon]